MPPATRNLRRPVLIGAAIAVVAIAAGALVWARVDDEGGGLLPSGGEYTEAVTGEWQRINPLYASLNEVDADVSQLVFSGLVRVGADGSVEPDLAALPDVSSDGTTYTFHISDRAAWHDGTRVTSHDVAFTIEQITDPGFQGSPELAERWLEVQVETPDDRTVVFHLKEPSAPFLARNATIGILPEHLLGDLSAEELFEAPFNVAPVGSGPYRVEQIDSREVRLAANGAYHLGAPHIGTMRLKFYSDVSAAVRAVQSGDADGLMIRTQPTAEELDQINGLRGRTVEYEQRGAFIVLYLNNDQAAYFQDPRVRQAVSLLIDRKEIVDSAFRGVATASASAIAPGSWAYVPEYDRNQPDRERAMALLNAAGWAALPGSGILAKEGQEFRFTLRVDDDPVRVAVAQQVAVQLERAGIKATIASTTFAVLRRDFLQERKYDAAIAGWDQGPDPDPYFGWHSSQMGSAGLNIANFADVVADSLISFGRTSNDVEVRKDAYRQFQEVWSDLTPSVVIAYPRYIYVHPDSLEGAPEGPLYTAAGRFTDVHRWKL